MLSFAVWAGLSEGRSILFYGVSWRDNKQLGGDWKSPDVAMYLGSWFSLSSGFFCSLPHSLSRRLSWRQWWSQGSQSVYVAFGFPQGAKEEAVEAS